jgi:2'-5' RNA ligase
MRLFLAVNPDERFTTQLATQLDAWRRQLRIAWSRPQTWHFTLMFLGDWPADRVEELRAALAAEAATHERFAVTCGQIGAFPNLRRPQVLFLHAESDGRLEALAAGARRRVEAVWPDGPQDRKPFRAHLTFARVKRPLTRAQRSLLAQIEFAPWQPFTVDALRLVRSELRPEGARHSDLERFLLA